MAAGKEEAFLERWSRLKRGEQAAPAEAPSAVPAPAAAPKEAPPLPALESLTPESDFSAFMHPKVPELMRRTALKKLFQDPRYNVVDKFEAYWEDYTKAEGIPPELLEKLDQARRHVFGPKREEQVPEAEQASAPAAPSTPAAAEPQQKDVPGTQDT